MSSLFKPIFAALRAFALNAFSVGRGLGTAQGNLYFWRFERAQRHTLGGAGRGDFSEAWHRSDDRQRAQRPGGHVGARRRRDSVPRRLGYRHFHRRHGRRTGFRFHRRADQQARRRVRRQPEHQDRRRISRAKGSACRASAAACGCSPCSPSITGDSIPSATRFSFASSATSRCMAQAIAQNVIDGGYLATAYGAQLERQGYRIWPT